MLQKINLEDVDISSNDYLTKLTLSDYNWMEYSFQAVLPMHERIVHFKASYIGTADTEIAITETLAGRGDSTWKFCIASTKFYAFLTEYMTKHIASHNTNNAFLGNKETISFINDCIANADNNDITQK